MATQNPQLQELYRQGAQQAYDEGIRDCEQKRLEMWIWNNCKFPLECMFYVVFGIGCELADLQSREQGFINEVERAYFTAQASLLFPII